MRVIAGSLGGRTLHAPRGRSTRPTTDRVREALFSILGDLEGLRVLDLYAGSGALGIEALSRGARHATFVEASKPALAALRKNLEALGVEAQARVIAAPLERARRLLLPLAPFDLVLCDPPWQKLESALETVGRALRDLVGPDAELVVEHPAGAAVSVSGFLRQDDRRWGDTAATWLVPQKLP